MGREEYEARLHYDPRWKGPMKGRSCTDCVCLIIFLAFVGGWAGIGYYAYTFGDVATLLAPTDTEGRKCGFDSGVADKEYLVFFDLTKCINVPSAFHGCDTPQVCVKSCPRDDFVWEINRPLAAGNITALRESMICKIEVDVSDASFEELEMYVSTDVCANWYLNSSSWAKRCIPNGVPSEFINMTLTQTELSEAAEYVKLLAKVEEIVTHVYDDFIATRWTVLAILGCSVVVALIYILLLRWLATPVVFVSIVAVSLLLGYSTYRFYLLYSMNSSTFWLVLTIICGLMLGIILLVCIFLRNRIRLACRLIGEASKAVIGITSTLIFPLFPWALQILVVAYALVVAIYLLTLRVQSYKVQLGGNCLCPEDLGYNNGTVCLPEVFNSSCTEDGSACIFGGCYLDSTGSPWFSRYMHTYNIIGFLWLIFFVSAFEEMVLAGAFASWYWTFKKSDVPFFTLSVSLWRTIRYHVGTLAFGSFIITICRLVRSALEYIDEKLKKHDNELVAFLLKCMKCYFWLLEKFLKFINKNAYIMCSIHGKSFCASAINAFNLLMRNILQVFVLNKITDWLLFVGKILITGAITWGAWWYITTEYTTLNYWLVPVILVAVGAYLLSSVFFGVYSMAVDTLFLCFLEDSERNDGTPEKPYFMSKGLLKILRK